MKIFQKERDDGLQDILGSSKGCVASLSSLIERAEQPTQLSDETTKVIASFGEGRNFDLYYLQSILASVGPNKNDDVFLAEEIWAARQTPIHKQLNYMHDEKDIIGVITDSAVLDSAGTILTGESQIDLIKDIATQAVIWTHWADKSKNDRISKIIASIDSKELFVSMEALFRDFDYMMVGPNGESRIVARNEETAFLTKHLRSFGGIGSFEDHRVYRVLRNFTFSGKGVVEDPANPRSIIENNLINKVVTAQTNSLKVSAEYKMENPNEIADLKGALAKANEMIASLRSAEVSKASAEVDKAKAEVADLKGQIEALKALAAENKEKMEKMDKEAEAKVAEVEAKSKEEMDDAKAKLAEATTKLAEITAEKVVAQRVSKLVALNVAVDKANEVVKSFASLSDEMFEQIVPLYEVKAADKSTVLTEVDDAITKAKASETVEGKIEDVTKNDDSLTALSKSIASKLKFIKAKGE
jgi:hypothetical protein